VKKIGWFSCGAASAVAVKLTDAEPVYCDTGAEHPDNVRFMEDCRLWFGRTKIQILKSDKYQDTWDVWLKRCYLSGPDGAACTVELKVKPRLIFQQPHDVHVFGYTADANDVARARRMRETYPELKIETPLIDRGLTKAACLAIIEGAGIKPPVMYGLGFQNNNCIPCVKARSPSYWALVRKHFPEKFNRMADISRAMGVRLCWINQEKAFIDEIPADHPVSEAIQPDCDFLCHLAEQDIIEAIPGDGWSDGERCKQLARRALAD
jgi:hypothetical protein